MTITINQLVAGQGLLVDGVLYIVTEYNHVKPGKGSAFVRVRLRNVKTNAVIERTYKTPDRLEDVELEEREIEFLYGSEGEYSFMDHTTYEQFTLTGDEIGSAAKYLLENLVLSGLCYNGKVVKVNLPTFIEARIVETEPGIKGDSSRSGTKPAKIETGATIQVPLFVNAEDWIKLDTRTGEYVERVQK